MRVCCSGPSDSDWPGLEDGLARRPRARGDNWPLCAVCPGLGHSRVAAAARSIGSGQPIADARLDRVAALPAAARPRARPHAWRPHLAGIRTRAGGARHARRHGTRFAARHCGALCRARQRSASGPKPGSGAKRCSRASSSACAARASRRRSRWTTGGMELATSACSSGDGVALTCRCSSKSTPVARSSSAIARRLSVTPFFAVFVALAHPHYRCANRAPRPDSG